MLIILLINDIVANPNYTKYGLHKIESFKAKNIINCAKQIVEEFNGVVPNTIEELTTSIEALDWYYKVYIKKCKYKKSIPPEYAELVDKIKEELDVTNH